MMIRGSKILALFFAAALLGCDLPETEDQPQEREQPGVDMDAERDQGPDVVITEDRPETTPDTDATRRSPRPTPEFEIPTQTPGSQTEQDPTVPEIDLDAPQTEGAAGQQSGDAEIPEVDLNAPSTEGAAVTEEDADVTLPEIDSES